MDEFSWFIGLYEGEGSCGCYVKGSGKYAVWIQLKMTDLDVIQRARPFIGANKNITEQLHHTQKKVAYKLARHGEKVEQLLLKMYPHLSYRRKRQIDEALTKRKTLQPMPWD